MVRVEEGNNHCLSHHCDQQLLSLSSQPVRRESPFVAVLDDLVSVHDDGDEERENNVNEEADEGVEVHLGERVGGKRSRRQTE